jgi:hypothetical protein
MLRSCVGHAKHVASWITMACHVYDLVYCKMLTIVVCDK